MNFRVDRPLRPTILVSLLQSIPFMQETVSRVMSGICATLQSGGGCRGCRAPIDALRAQCTVSGRSSGLCPNALSDRRRRLIDLVRAECGVALRRLRNHAVLAGVPDVVLVFFFFKQKTAYEITV